MILPGLFKALRARLALRGIIVDPLQREALAPQAIVEQQRATSGYAAAKPAAAWSDDITRHNTEIAEKYEAEVARRTALFAEGKYTARFGVTDPETGVFTPDIAYDVQFEMARQNVTGLQAAFPLLSAKEHADARTISGLESEIEAIEVSQMDRTVNVPARPSRQEILAASDGNVDRAALLQARVNELFGEDTDG